MCTKSCAGMRELARALLRAVSYAGVIRKSFPENPS